MSHPQAHTSTVQVPYKASLKSVPSRLHDYIPHIQFFRRLYSAALHLQCIEVEHPYHFEIAT